MYTFEDGVMIASCDIPYQDQSSHNIIQIHDDVLRD